MKKTFLNVLVVMLTFISMQGDAQEENAQGTAALDTELINHLQEVKASLDEEILGIVRTFNNQKESFIHQIRAEISSAKEKAEITLESVRISDETVAFIQKYSKIGTFVEHHKGFENLNKKEDQELILKPIKT
ncbi:MAG: hypothetical protein HY390_00040 [Deltaproteobacteria bacterium]|nr:hypothetical protein [Deltaproteobacteria bacterium]